MGWGRTLLLGDIGNRMDIGDGQGTSKTPSGTSTASADSSLFHINQKPKTRNTPKAFAEDGQVDGIVAGRGFE